MVRYLFGPDEVVQGVMRLDQTQVALNLTQLFGPRFGSTQSVLAFDAAWVHVHDMPKRSELLLNAPGTFRLEKGIQGALEGGRITVLRKDATACAESMGHPRAANVILLAAAVGAGLFPMDRKTLIEAVRAVSPARVANQSLAAVEAGFSP